MPTRVVRDWLSEFKTLPESELSSYATAVRHNDELVDALYDMFEQDVPYEELDPVCHQLFEFYRCGHPDLQRFTLEAIPVMIGAYLTAHSHSDKKRCSSIEACLLGVYNLEVIQPDGKPKTKSYTIPTLAVPSIYHEPPSLATLALTETALEKYHSTEHMKITVSPLPQIERINSQNRMMTLRRVLSAYNSDIANLSPRSHFALCKVSSRLVKMGFNDNAAEEMEPCNLNESRSSSGSRRGVQFHVEPHITIDSGLLIEMLNGIYFAMFNGQASDGIQAVDDIHQRAMYELYADVLLVTNAIKNSLLYNPSGQPKDGPMGISIALSPTQGSPTFSKSAITNASFRTKRLPGEPLLLRMCWPGGVFRKCKTDKTSEDIDVPEETTSTATKHTPAGASEDTPPRYEEVVNASGEKNVPSSKGSGARLSKPLKSIMKKSSFAGDKPEKGSKLHKKESDSKAEKKNQGGVLNDGEPHSPKNPKHSMSVSTGLGSAQNGITGEFVDPAMVGIQVMRSSSSVTGRSFQLVDYVDGRQKTSATVISRTSSGLADDTRMSANCDHLQDVSNSNKHQNTNITHDDDDDDGDDDDINPDDDELAEDTVDTQL